MLLLAIADFFKNCGLARHHYFLSPQIHKFSCVGGCLNVEDIPETSAKALGRRMFLDGRFHQPFGLTGRDLCE